MWGWLPILLNCKHNLVKDGRKKCVTFFITNSFLLLANSATQPTFSLGIIHKQCCLKFYDSWLLFQTLSSQNMLKILHFHSTFADPQAPSQRIRHLWMIPCLNIDRRGEYRQLFSYPKICIHMLSCWNTTAPGLEFRAFASIVNLSLQLIYRHRS